jgi:hypothetical protein
MCVCSQLTFIFSTNVVTRDCPVTNNNKKTGLNYTKQAQAQIITVADKTSAEFCK